MYIGDYKVSYVAAGIFRHYVAKLQLILCHVDSIAIDSYSIYFSLGPAVAG